MLEYSILYLLCNGHGVTYYSIHYTGWLVHAAVTEDPEMATILLWEKKAKERLRKRYSYTKLVSDTDSLLIMDVPVVVLG